MQISGETRLDLEYSFSFTAYRRVKIDLHPEKTNVASLTFVSPLLAELKSLQQGLKEQLLEPEYETTHPRRSSLTNSVQEPKH